MALDILHATPHAQTITTSLILFFFSRTSGIFIGSRVSLNWWKFGIGRVVGLLLCIKRVQCFCKLRYW